MADEFGSLGEAYSILGQATTAEYKRRRKEEDEYRKKARKDKIFSYLAAPLLKSAGETLTQGITGLITGPEEEKYEEFLSSEQVMAQKHRQKVLNQNALALQAKHKKALESETGVLNYYTNLFYDQKLNNFNREHPEEEYSEGKNGVFYQQAREEAAKALPILEQAYARSLNVRDPEELDSALSKAYGSRDILSVLGRAVTNPFKGTKREDLRQQRLDFLQQQSNIKSESIQQAMSVLGQDTSVAALAGYAADVEEFKINRQDYILKSKSAAKNYTVNFDDGKNASVKAIEVTYQHPNDPARTVTEWMPIKGNERSERVLAQVRAGKGTILEDTKREQIDSGYGYPYIRETTTKRIADGRVEIITKNIKSETVPPTQAALKATAGDIRTAGEAYNSAAQVITTPFADGGKQLRVVDSQIAETVLSQGLGGEQVKDLGKRKDMLYANIHGYSVSLQSRMANVQDIGERQRAQKDLQDGKIDRAEYQEIVAGLPSLDKDAALTLSAVAQARYFGGLQGKEESYIRQKGFITKSPDWADINFDSSTGLNPVNFRKAGSVYALDAFFAAEETGIKVSLTKKQFNALRSDAIESFNLLPISNRNQFLTYFKDQEELKEINPITGRPYFLEFDVSS